MLLRRAICRVPIALAAVVCLSPRLLADETLYVDQVRPLLKAKCWSCHGPLRQEAGLRLDSAELVRRGSDDGAVIAPGDAAASRLIDRISAADPAERMPPEGEPLTAEQVARVAAWIQAGAVAPQDEAAQDDPRSHWSFQPLPNGPPRFANIDGFIRARLAENHLAPAPPADRVTLIRRLYLDMHALPPAPDEVDAFVADERPDAWARLVDRVLASPRYGERWAQHWLDVVRYADTHGFEVNTPREHAWPYRDYVIRAFNDDKPYDRFVFEQLAGDTVGQDAATGFLVASAVLLPGQIGADDESKRQARQDALDEIIVGTSATFLGLTVGCARCHDHKFDPITQQDYYGLQAFFAGVEYGDHEVHDELRDARLAAAARLAPRIADIRAQLDRLEPRRDTAGIVMIDDEDTSRVTWLQTIQGHGENPPGTNRGYRDDAGAADRMPNLSRGRYTWWTNVPGQDVCAWSPGVEGRYRLWLSWGVHGSGAHTRDARYLIDRDGDLQTTADQEEIARVNQHHFARADYGTDEQRPLWSGLQDAGIHAWSPGARLVLRGGETGTAITADVILLEELPEGAALAGESPLPCLRAPVDPKGNVERFHPVEARYVRFTTLETVDDNRHEPCLDELEIYSAGDRQNVALASAGARATSSGNYSETGIHQLPHVNDGQYGNSHSWISNQLGAGWVQIELAEPRVIDRIAWSRDREGRFADRLSVRYRIEVSTNGEDWRLVASSGDRLARGTPYDELPALLRSHPGETSAEVSARVAELEALEAQHAELSEPRYVYAGKFRPPDETFVLNRGNPEQREEPVGPTVPAILGSYALARDADETSRRAALARWLTDPGRPLPARVIVNRVWQYHFGRGLVDTASDFGLNGGRPSHPELLDWLARTFIADGWSIKRLQRRILLSETYRQSNRIDPAARTVDADCRWLWRFPSRRLEAEAIRDCILAVSGELNLEMGGPGFNFFKSRGGLNGFPPVETFGPNELRRMIYAHKVRMEPVPVFGAFDCPDAGQPVPQRTQSITAIQALNLFNSPFVVDQARALAARIELEAGTNPDDQLRHAYRLVLSRTPREDEAAASAAVVRDHGLATLCRVLFNSNEFLFLP